MKINIVVLFVYVDWKVLILWCSTTIVLNVIIKNVYPGQDIKRYPWCATQ